MTTDLRVTQTDSSSVIFAISVCKTPIRKRNSHGDHKERKGTDDHGSEGSPKPNPVLAIFAISVCKNPIGKRNSHGDHKEHKGTDDHGSKGHPNRFISVIFAISVCKNPIRRRNSHGDHKGTDDPESEGPFNAFKFLTLRAYLPSRSVWDQRKVSRKLVTAV